MERYNKVIAFWDQVFNKEEIITFESSDLGNEVLNGAMDWLCQGSRVILDFGCGSGTMLFKCALRGTEEHIGIDLSKEAIQLAEKRKEVNNKRAFKFIHGNFNQLKDITSQEVDAIILSNILDNLIPEDAMKVLKEAKRVLKKEGKLLVKLNSYMTQEKRVEWDVKVIEGNLLDDGLLLWNLTYEEWIEILERDFKIVTYKELYYPEYEQYNRMFYLMNKEANKR